MWEAMTTFKSCMLASLRPHKPSTNLLAQAVILYEDDVLWVEEISIAIISLIHECETLGGYVPAQVLSLSIFLAHTA